MSVHPLWDKSLSERLAPLSPDTHRIAYFSPTPDFGTFRYRCFNPVDALLAHSTVLSASFFFYSDLEILDDLSNWVDTLVVVRAPYDERIDSLYRQFRNAGKRVLFDIDDLVFDLRYATLVASNLGYELQEEELNQWSAFISNTGLSLARADGVITTNIFLADRVRDVTELPVWVIPNTFNSTQEKASEQPHELRFPQPGSLRLGYFSGSNSHSLDFDVVAETLAVFLRESPQSTLTVVGHLDIPEVLQSVDSQISRVAFMDFVDMQGVLAAMDLNIVPLQSSAFTFCKSELKYFEAALVATPTLASRTPVFEHALEQGITGFLADSGTWLARLREIAALSPEQRAGIGQAAKISAQEKYSPERLAKLLEEVLGEEK
jgi:glycosyltransferase involved in cell wall biosynthesis